MKIYIDSDYKCHADQAEGLREFEVPAFDNKCKTFINGYRYIPIGESWTRYDGEIFVGEMIAPSRNYEELAEAQASYDEAKAEAQAEIADMQTALGILGVE